MVSLRSNDPAVLGEMANLVRRASELVPSSRAVPEDSLAFVDWK